MTSGPVTIIIFLLDTGPLPDLPLRSTQEDHLMTNKYRIEYLDCAGILQEIFSVGNTPAAAMAHAAACEPRVHRIVKALPITGA